MMGLSLEGMKDHIYSFFSEINRRRSAKRKGEGSAPKEKKKMCEGTPRELKRLESSINYDGRRKEEKKLGEGG